MMRPILVVLEDGQWHSTAEIRAALADEFSLTRKDLAQQNPKGANRHVNLVAFAFHHLSRACLIERSRMPAYRITKRGREVLVSHPTRVDIPVCMLFDEWHHSRARRKARLRAAGVHNGPPRGDRDHAGAAPSPSSPAALAEAEKAEPPSRIEALWTEVRAIGLQGRVYQIPELMGPTEVARELGVRQSNLGAQVGLPDPLPRPPAPKVGGRLWIAEEIREFARKRQTTHSPD